MHLLAVSGKEDSGAYAVNDRFGQKVLYLFVEEDDAIRYAMMLEDDGSPEMHVIEVEDDIMLKTCDLHDYNSSNVSSPSGPDCMAASSLEIRSLISLSLHPMVSALYSLGSNRTYP